MKKTETSETMETETERRIIDRATEAQRQAEKETDKKLSVLVKHGMPLEHVFRSSAMKNAIRSAFSVVRDERLKIGIVGSDAMAEISADSLGEGRYRLYLSAKEAGVKNQICVLTASGVKMAKYALWFSRC